MLLQKAAAYCCLLSLCPLVLDAQSASAPEAVFGYHDFSAQSKIDQDFLKVPDAKLAGEHLKTLTAAPHIAASKEDYATAEYVAAKFKAAGLETTIVPYKVLLNLPREIRVTATGENGKTLMTGPTREHVDGDPFQNDPRVVMPFNGSSTSCDIKAPVVYANYGRLEDFKRLDEMHVDIKNKIVIVRYGGNFRGVKAYIAQQRGAAGVIIYSDPADDGYFRGEKYPNGPYRPDTGVQRGSIGYIFKYPGDPTTPGVASTMDLPDSKRIPADQADGQPKIASTPISYHDASPILEHLAGPEAPRAWQGALPFNYHVGGTSSVEVHMVLKQDYSLRTIWDVIGKIPGTDFPDEWVVAGNHRDAWVYGAVDPNSGTAAMLETVHGIGDLLKSGWKPRRTIVFGSWDAEEEGLIGSTEWVEEHEQQLAHAVAYFNTDVGVAGPEFNASAVPSLKQFVREVTKEVPSPKGGTVYAVWKQGQKDAEARRAANGAAPTRFNAHVDDDVEIGDLGSGSDFTPFIQHIGVPSTDIGSQGPYGVYHSVFDNYKWFTMNADPTFVYEKQQAQVFGLEVLHMADADVLPYDYISYGKSIAVYLDTAKKKAATANMQSLDFTAAMEASSRFTAAATHVHEEQLLAPKDAVAFNRSLRDVETALLAPEGLPNRAWFKHTIYAPGEYTGYAAVVIPGVTEAIDAGNPTTAQAQMAVLAAALNRASAILEAAR